MSNKFFRTTITVEILSEGEFGEGSSLEQIAWTINEGDCVGRLTYTSADEVTPKEMADALHEYGSEPGFFELNDDGTRVDDELEHLGDAAIMDADNKADSEAAS